MIKKLGFHNSRKVEAFGFLGGIWILWSSFIQINTLVNHVQFVQIEVSCASQNINFLFTAVYGSPHKQYRKFLWQDLELLADSILSPWMLAEIQHWNSTTFGGIENRKRILLRQINGIQSSLELHLDDPSDFLVELEASLREELEDVCFQEELLWLQKSSSDWVCLGDWNTGYYHLKALMRKSASVSPGSNSRMGRG
ncbi:hypothetical protein K1719_038342 [Acacia pycnantha]|nr:hypothetical protein K1719_038342 [Acacia pycnantha]